MKNTLLISLLACAVLSQAQTKLALSKGTKLEYEMKTYPLAFEINKDWFGMNDKKKDKEAVKISADIASGKVAPKTTQTLQIAVNDAKTENGRDVMLSRFTMPGFETGIRYQSTADTVYSYYADGVPYPVMYNGDTAGTAVFGVRKYPLNPSVGGYIPGLINDGYGVPKESMSVTRTSFNIPRGSYSYHGFVTMRQKMTITSSNTTIYFPGLITGKEDFTVDGKTYTAWKVNTPIWFKLSTTVDKQEDPETYFNDKSLSDEIKANQKALEEAAAKKTSRKIDKMTGANDKGYIESYEENWYVPELGGYVKTIHYDKDGIVQWMSVLKSVKS